MIYGIKLPTGEDASKVKIEHLNVDVPTLDCKITVGVYDSADNRIFNLEVPFKLDEFREVTIEEQLRIVDEYFRNSETTEASSSAERAAS